MLMSEKNGLKLIIKIVTAELKLKCYFNDNSLFCFDNYNSTQLSPKFPLSSIQNKQFYCNKQDRHIKLPQKLSLNYRFLNSLLHIFLLLIPIL
jgi:hypothetical protein